MGLLLAVLKLGVVSAVMVGGLAVTGTGAAPAGAVTGVTSGGSIVFIKACNVWLTSPDGPT